MIRRLRQIIACRRLNKLVAKQRARFETIDFAKRRQAALSYTRRAT